jgi:hypothetical protein
MSRRDGELLLEDVCRFLAAVHGMRVPFECVDAPGDVWIRDQERWNEWHGLRQRAGELERRLWLAALQPY